MVFNQNRCVFDLRPYLALKSDTFPNDFNEKPLICRSLAAPDPAPLSKSMRLKLFQFEINQKHTKSKTNTEKLGKAAKNSKKIGNAMKNCYQVMMMMSFLPSQPLELPSPLWPLALKMLI